MDRRSRSITTTSPLPASEDVRVPAAGSDRGDLGPTEAAEHSERPKTVPAEQRHTAVRVDDDRRAVQRRSHHQRVGEVNTLEHVAALRPERDGEDLVRGFGNDERDGPRPCRRGNEEGRRSAAATAARAGSCACLLYASGPTNGPT
jgi:hypothetical protein